MFVTILWATSWVLVKIGLGAGLPPLTFAGLRYGLAWLCLLPLALRPANRRELAALSRRGWLALTALGLCFYSITQGALFVALAHLPAATVNLLVSFSAIGVGILGISFLAERPSSLQWAGLLVAAGGALLFFYPVQLLAGQAIGYAAGLVALLANALSAIFGRQINQGQQHSPLIVTVVSMGAGAAVLLVLGLGGQGLPPLSGLQWAIIGWLAIVNTAFAFTLWNQTLRTLTALESSIINGLLIVQIPLLAWVFLGEALTLRQVAGLALAAAGTLLVQLRHLRRGAQRV